MPRRRFRDPDPLVRDRNQLEILGAPGLSGLSRIGARPGGGTSLVVRPPANGLGTQIEHVTLHAEAGQTIAAGGGTVQWDRIAPAPTEIRGFTTAAEELAESGTIGAIPVDLTGGAILIPILQFCDKTTGQPLDETGVDCTVTVTRVRADLEQDWPDHFWDTDLIGVDGPLSGLVDAGDELRVTVDPGENIKVNGRISVMVWGIASPTSRQDLAETMWVDTRSSTGTTSSTVLASGSTYTVVVTGNMQVVADGDNFGDPDDLMFPSPGQTEDTFATNDPDVRYSGASNSPPPPTHDNNFQLDTGSGWSHVEPDGGPYSSPQSGHVYRYTIVGEGAALSARRTDTFYDDNNGQFKVEIYRGTI